MSTRETTALMALAGVSGLALMVMAGSLVWM